MADAMDIMSVNQANARPSEAAQLISSLRRTDSVKKVVKEKKPEGINRELYSLIGGAPPLVPEEEFGFKEKPNLGAVRAAEWKWASFKNPARSDGLVLHHWAKVDDVDREYHFAKFNKKTQLPRYTDEEYEELFTDSNWSKKETDELLNACEQYDLRFPVILDRLETNRSLEDLKDRYYKIAKRLIELRNPLDPNSANYQSLKEEAEKHNFDKAREIERKAQLEVLHKRTIEQVKEEEMLIIEARKIEQNSKKILKDRQHVVKLLENIDAAFPIKKFFPQKRHFETLKLSNVRSPTPVEPLEPVKKKRRGSQKLPSEDGAPSTPVPQTFAQPEQPSLEAPPSSNKKKEKIPPGPSVRSSRLATPLSVGTKMQKRIDQSFEELEISPRPSIPTASVCQVFDDIRNDILTLLELKKVTDKKELEVKVLENRKAQLEQSLSDKEKSQK